MEVILLEKIHNLGDLGEQVKVKSGYARNFLLPQSKAVTATAANVKKFEARRAELEKAAAEIRAKAEARAKSLQNIVLAISAKAGDEGKLFGSIGTKDLADAFAAVGAEVHKSEIHLPNGPMRQVGEYEVNIQLHSDVSLDVKVVISSEGSAAAE